MVESAVGLRSASLIEVTSIPNTTSELKLPHVACAGKILKLHKNNRISITNEDQKHWKMGKESLNAFLDHHFTSIQKIEILKKIFHGMHTNERSFALRYLKNLKKK